MATKPKRNVPRWVRELLAELVGTFIIILIGTGGIATYKLAPRNHDGSSPPMDLFGIAFNFGLAVMVAVAAAYPISGAHCNPAVTLAFVLVGRFPAHKMAHYFVGQYVGAFLGSFAVYTTYYEAINTYDAGHRTAWYPPSVVDHHRSRSVRFNDTGDIFSTFPAPWITPVGALVDQIIATGTYIFGAVAITSPHAGLPAHLHPFMLGMLTCSLVIAFGLNCGAVLNPARDFGPRVFQLVAGYGTTAFKPVDSLYWLTGGIIGPYLGGALGAWAYSALLIYDDKDDVPKIKVELKKVSPSESVCATQTVSVPIGADVLSRGDSDQRRGGK